MRKADTVELSEDEALELVVVECVKFGTVGDSCFEIAVNAKL